MSICEADEPRPYSLVPEPRLGFEAILGQNLIMSYTVKVKNGVVVLPADVKLPEGLEVAVIIQEVQPVEDPFLAAVQKLAKPRPHWPKDYALNHGHYRCKPRSFIAPSSFGPGRKRLPGN